MTSSINTDNIDPTFPIAGTDNNSQGFRDNFLYIKEGLESAAADITDLQSNTARLDDSNNFQGNLISNASTVKVYGLAYSASEGSDPPGEADINLENGPLQYLYANSTELTITFRGWPELGLYASIRVHIIGDLISSKTVTLATENSGLMKFPTGLSNGLRLVYDVNKSVVGTYAGGQPQVVVNNVSELEVGFNVIAQSGVIPAGTTIEAIDANNNAITFSNDLDGEIADGTTIEFTSASVQTKVVELWTYNGGATVFVNYLGKFE